MSQKKLQKGLGSIPLDTLVKAQRSMKKASKKSATQASYDDVPTGNSREDKIAAMKARLASMQRAKGKASGVPYEDDEAGPSRRHRRDDDEDEEGRRERQKREHKHA